MYRYFKPEEFLSASPACSIEQMNPDFMQKLDAARHWSGVPFHITSAYRSPDWDKSKGRSGSGYHTKGRAVDVCCTDSALRYRIIDGCLSAGLSVGIAKTFIHIDDRSPVIAFLY